MSEEIGTTPAQVRQNAPSQGNELVNLIRYFRGDVAQTAICCAGNGGDLSPIVQCDSDGIHCQCAAGDDEESCTNVADGQSRQPCALYMERRLNCERAFVRGVLG